MFSNGETAGLGLVLLLVFSIKHKLISMGVVLKLRTTQNTCCFVTGNIS
jgi:hypothetical protein